jgi:hypothetical protein
LSTTSEKLDLNGFFEWTGVIVARQRRERGVDRRGGRGVKRVVDGVHTMLSTSKRRIMKTKSVMFSP